MTFKFCKDALLKNDSSFNRHYEAVDIEVLDEILHEFVEIEKCESE